MFEPTFRASPSVHPLKNIVLRDYVVVLGERQFGEPVRINSEDAKKRGVADGDLVELTNERGTVICGAVISDEVRPGVASLYEGGRPQLGSKGRCNSGLINFIMSSRRSSGLTRRPRPTLASPPYANVRIPKAGTAPTSRPPSRRPRPCESAVTRWARLACSRWSRSYRRP